MELLEPQELSGIPLGRSDGVSQTLTNNFTSGCDDECDAFHGPHLQPLILFKWNEVMAGVGLRFGLGVWCWGLRVRCRGLVDGVWGSVLGVVLAVILWNIAMCSARTCTIIFGSGNVGDCAGGRLLHSLRFGLST